MNRRLVIDDDDLRRCYREDARWYALASVVISGGSLVASAQGRATLAILFAVLTVVSLRCWASARQRSRWR